MKIIEITDPISKLAGIESEFEVRLTPKELDIIRQAHAICDRATELEETAIRKSGLEEKKQENQYGWAAIYLRGILDSNSQGD